MAEGPTQAACKWDFIFSAQPQVGASAGERPSAGVQPVNSVSTPRETTSASPSFDLGTSDTDAALQSAGRLPGSWAGGRLGSGTVRRRSSPWTAGKPSPGSYRGLRGVTRAAPLYIQESVPGSLAPGAAFSLVPAGDCAQAAAVAAAPPTATATWPPTQPAAETLAASSATATAAAGATAASPYHNVPPDGRHGARSPPMAVAEGHRPPPQPSGWTLHADIDQGDSRDAFAELISLLLMPDEGEDGAEAAAATASAPTGATGSGAGAPGFGSSQRAAFKGGGEGGARAGADRGGIGGLYDLDALAAALDEVDAALGREWTGGPPPELLLPLGSEGEGEGGPPRGMEGSVLPGPGGAAWGEGQQGWRRARRVMRRGAPTAASAARGGVVGSGTGTVEGAPPGAGGGGGSRSAGLAGAMHSSQGTGSGEADNSWQIMVAAPTPHNPEALATLLVAGRLVNPQTAVPAPLLAAAAQQQQQTTTTTGQQKRRGGGDEDEPVVVVGGGGAAGVGAGGRDGHSQGPAVALVRCRTEYDVTAALELHGRRVYCPPLAPGGPGSWQPLRVVLKSVPHGGPLKAPSLPGAPSASSPSPREQARVRDVGPSSRKLLLTGLPGHLDGDDLMSLFGTGVQLPGHCPRPQDRRFLLVCRDATAFDALMAWSGTRLPYKPLDALRQIVPRVVDWTTLRVAEDDGIQLPALMSDLLAAARLPTAGSSSAQPAAAAAAAARHHSQQQQPQLRPPRVAGRFHPAELDEMDEMAAAAPPAEGGAAGGVRDGDEGPPRAVSASAPASGSGAATAGPGGGGGGGGPSGAPPCAAPDVRAPGQDVDDIAAAAAAAERAESSRGASSSGLAARPAPRPRRGGGGGGGKYASSVGAAGSGGFFFGAGGPTGGAGAAAAAPGCSCCPGPLSGMGGFGGGGGGASSAILEGSPMSWSGQAAMDLLNKLLALGIDPGLAEGGAGSQEEEDRAPFFRRSRKRMPVHFGRRPEDEDEEEGGEEGGDDKEGVEAGSGTGATVPTVAATAVGTESADAGGAEGGQGGQGSEGGGGGSAGSGGENAPAAVGAANTPPSGALDWRSILDEELL